MNNQGEVYNVQSSNPKWFHHLKLKSIMQQVWHKNKEHRIDYPETTPKQQHPVNLFITLSYPVTIRLVFAV